MMRHDLSGSESVHPQLLDKTIRNYDFAGTAWEMRKRAAVAQFTREEFQGRLCKSAEVCPAYACSDRRRWISGKTSSIVASSAIALPKAASSRSSS
jgi:hypothetical protein